MPQIVFSTVNLCLSFKSIYQLCQITKLTRAYFKRIQRKCEKFPPTPILLLRIKVSSTEVSFQAFFCVCMNAFYEYIYPEYICIHILNTYIYIYIFRIYVYVCLYVYMCVYIYVYTHTHIYTHIYTYTYIRTHTHTHVSNCISACGWAYNLYNIFIHIPLKLHILYH